MTDRDASTVVKPRGVDNGEGRLCFEVVVGQAVGRRLFLEEDSLTIGRDANAEIQLDGEGISRQHARVSVSATEVVTLEDLGSTNGLFVNGRRVDVVALRVGDRVEIGTEVTLLFTRYESPVSEEFISVLSPRELEVAQLIATGMTNAEVGKRLFISRATVARHVANMFDKLGIRSRTALTRYLIDHGLA